MHVAGIAQFGPSTLLSLFASVISTAVGFLYFETGPFVFLLGVYLTISIHLRETQDRSASERDRDLISAWSHLSGEIRDRLERGPRVAKRSAAIRHPYLKTLAETMLERSAVEADGLARPIREFRTEAQYFQAAWSDMKTLGKGDRVRVICADSPTRWNQSKPLRRYVVENYAAVQRGVDFVRVLPARGPATVAEARQQASQGVTVVLVPERAIAELPEWQRVPDDVGIGVVNETRVYFHCVRDGQWYGCMFESAFVASLVLSVFAALEAHGEIVTPTTTA
jgi:hypothetical protein